MTRGELRQLKLARGVGGRQYSVGKPSELVLTWVSRTDNAYRYARSDRGPIASVANGEHPWLAGPAVTTHAEGARSQLTWVGPRRKAVVRGDVASLIRVQCLCFPPRCSAALGATSTSTLAVLCCQVHSLRPSMLDRAVQRRQLDLHVLLTHSLSQPGSSFGFPCAFANRDAALDASRLAGRCGAQPCPYAADEQH